MVSEKVEGSQRITQAASFLLVSAMLACFTLSLVQVGELILSDWQGDYLVWLAFFVALEAMYSQRRLERTSSFFEPEYIAYRAAELVVILILLKVSYYFTVGFGQLQLDLPLWQEDFGRYFLIGEYVFGVIVLFLVWMLGGAFSSELYALEVTEPSLRAEIESGIFEQRPAARERIANIFLGLGILMVFLAAALRLDFLANWADLPELRAGVYNVLAYFLLGLVLLSLTQYNLMRVSWLLDHLPIQKEIASRWFIYSFVFILAVALIASFLPTSYSIGLLSILKYIFMTAIGIITLLFSIIAFPFVMLFNLVLGLFGGETQSMPLQAPEIPRYEPPPAIAGQESIPWLEIVKSILFWVIFLAVIGFAIYYYLREHRELLDELRRLPVFSSLVRFWTWMRRQLGVINRQVTTAVDESWQRLKERLRRKPAEEAWKFINLRNLSPRGRVFFYYLALVRRGGERGIQRHPSQTPFEYSLVLAEKLGDQQDHAPRPEVAEEIENFTERFVDARYSLHDVTDQDVSLVRRYWQHIRKFLRGKISA